MKTRELRKLVLVLFTILLTGSTVFAQGWRGGNRAGYGRNLNWAADTTQLTCINLIPGLTEDQKTQITNLESEHQKAMAELRTERRSTFDAAEKNAIRIKMLERVQNHRNEVRNLLTDEQQKQYDLLQARNQAWQQGYRQGRRNAPQRSGFYGRGGSGRGAAAGYGRGRWNNQ
jgi:hypothetical protein